MVATSTPGTETFGGEQRTIIAAGATSNVKTSPGRVARILVHTGSTGAIDVYDHASANNNKVWGSGASPGVGSVYELDCPMVNGIRIACGTGTGVTVVWS